LFFISRLKIAFCLLSTMVLTACGTVSPNYAPSIANVESFKKSGIASAKVGVVSVANTKSGATSITIRAATMASSVAPNYGAYLAAAMKQELDMAKLYDEKSTLEITGDMIKNDIAGMGITTASGEMEVRFMVKSNGAVRFDKVKAVTHSWESSFVGAIAIPKAQGEYPTMVQKLISALIADPEFIQALKP
jgi:hypothetical protein